MYVPDVILGGGVEPLAPALREHVQVTLLVHVLERGQRVQQQHRATGVETQVVCQLLCRRGLAREPREDSQLLPGDRDPRHGHAEQRVPGGNRREVQAYGEPVERGVWLQAGAHRPGRYRSTGG